MKKGTRVIALFLSLSLILPGMAQSVPTVVKAESKSSVPGGPSKNENGIMTWDCVYFGNYWQRDTNKDGAVDQRDAKEPIKWRVLSVEGNDAFLMADQPLDCRKYSGNQNDFSIDVDYESELPATWEDCSLRTWLNETFYQDAFSQEEGEAIQTVTVTNEDNPITGIGGGNNTEDKVYLLSLSEAVTAAYGFSTGSGESVSRAAEGTKYAEKNDSMDFDLDSYWWLRSPGVSQTSAVIISPSGQVGINGMPVDFAPLGVRPVLHIDLSASSVWKSAGTETGTKPVTPTSTPTGTVKPTSKPTGTTKPTAKPAPTTTMQPGQKKAISSFEDLQAMEDIPSGNYYLTKDIAVPANTRLFQDYPFTGTLDGKGHKINGYKVQKKYVFREKITHVTLDAGVNYDNEDLFSEAALVGLFCRAKGATFQNLSLTNVDINVQTEAYATVGALVREADGCKFNNVHVSGKISVQSIRENPLYRVGFVVGGIVGSSGATMTNCSNSASISVNCKNGEYAGGVSVGGLSGTYADKITKCSNSGNISVIGYCGDQDLMRVAGLVPEVEKSITSCKNSGNVSLKVQAGKGNKHEIPNGDDNNVCHEIFILKAKVAGIAVNTDNIKSSGNTGKISLDYPLTFSIEPTQFLSGVVCEPGTAKRCYNKGTVSFSGNATGIDTEDGDDGMGGLVVAGLFVDCDWVKECYNTGKVTAKNNKKKVNSFVVAGVLGMSTAHAGSEIRNCYNTGKISLKGKGRGMAAGVVGSYVGDKTGKTRMRYNYNVGKITATKKSLKGSILGYQDDNSSEMANKRLVHDNYYKGSVKPCGQPFYGKYKKWSPKAKKVSSITRAKCPKLSSKYWVYSSKVKRLILKNNKETNLGIKAKKSKKTKAGKKTKKKTKKKTTKKNKKKTTKKKKK